MRLCLVGVWLLASLGDPALAEEAQWSVEAVDEQQSINGTLSCEDEPTPGPFQCCKVFLRLNGQPAASLQHVSVSGGMPAHGHGLPTSPQTIEASRPGEYLIRGLKFSMPGEWVLNVAFQHQNTHHSLRFDFNLEP